MAWIPRDITDSELAVLRALWQTEAATIRQLTDQLYPGGRPAHYATVQKLLERLERKSCVERRLEGRVNVFRATVERGEIIRRRLRELADKVCGGSLTPLLTHLVDSGGLSEEELTTLRELVDRLDGETARESAG